MAEKSERKPDDPAQYKRFLEAARKAQAEDSKEAADKAFEKVISSSRNKTKSRP